MPFRGTGHAAASASSSEPLLGIKDGVRTPPAGSLAELGGWRRWQHLLGGPLVCVAGILILGTASGLGLPDIYTPLPPWAAKISSVVGESAPPHLIRFALEGPSLPWHAVRTPSRPES